MSLQEVMCYRVVCDRCDCCAQDDGDYASWQDPNTALDEAVYAEWYVVNSAGKPIVTLCPEHTPQCACPVCPAPGLHCRHELVNDDFGTLCEFCHEHTFGVQP